MSKLILTTFLFLTFSAVETPLIARKQSTKKPPILWTVDWSPPGKYYAVGGTDRLLRIYDVKKNKLIASYPLTRTIQCLDWDSKGRQVAIAIHGQAAQIFDIETKSFVTLHEIDGSRALAWNPKGDLLAVADYSGAVKIFTRRGKLTNSIRKENKKN